jgi:hypothetical protein
MVGQETQIASRAKPDLATRPSPPAMDLIPNASNIAIQTLLHTLHSNFSLVPFGALLVYLASLLSTLWRQRSGLTVEQRRQIVQTVIVPRKSSVWTFLSVQLFKQLYTTRRPKMCLDDLIQEVAAGNGELRTPVDHISNLLANQTLRLACDVSIQLTVGNQLVSQLITWRLQGILPTFTHPRVCAEFLIQPEVLTVDSFP